MKQKDQSASDEVGLKKKNIVFRNPYTKQIIAEVQIPNSINLTKNQVCNLKSLRNRLRMLYIDVLCRGYHPVKGFQMDARNVFQTAQQKLNRGIDEIIISNNQAIGTIWRCLARQLGRPIKNYNFKQVSKQLFGQLKKMKQKVMLDNNQYSQVQESEENTQYQQLLNQLNCIQDNIQQFMNKIQFKCKTDINKLQKSQKLLAKVIGQQILDLQRDIFIKSIVGIRQNQTNTNLVDIILEQSYPIIIMSQQKAIQSIGETIFNNKCDKYQKYQKNYKLNRQISEQIIVCHRCLLPLNQFSNVGECNDSLAIPQISNTLLTDPYQYNKRIMNQNCWDSQTKYYHHPYLSYYFLKGNQKRPLCNRYFCNKCEGAETTLFTAGYCNYCQGTCQCNRCSSSDLLTKMMAVFIDNGGDLKSLTQKFLMQFPTKTLQINNKNSQKSFQESIENFQSHLQVFYQKSIFLKKKTLRSFEKTLYFGNKIQIKTINQQKYKQRRVELDQAQTDKQDRKNKQRKAIREIRKINQMLRGYRKRPDPQNAKSYQKIAFVQQKQKKQYHSPQISSQNSDALQKC